MVKIGRQKNRPNTLVSASSVRWRTLAEKVYCIPPAEVALNLAVGDFERNGDIYGHWGGMGVSSEENESE